MGHYTASMKRVREIGKRLEGRMSRGIADNLKLERLGMCGLDDFVSISLRQTGDIKPFTVSQNEEYSLQGKIEVRFWANKAELQTARDIALKTLYAGLFAEVAQFLPRLRLAISDGSKLDAFTICDAMEDAIRNPAIKGERGA